MKPEQLAILSQTVRIGSLHETMAHLQIGAAHRLGDQQFRRLAKQLLPGIAEQQLGLAIDHDDPPLAVEQQKGIRRSFHHVPEALLVSLARLQIEQVENVINALVTAKAGQAHRYRNRRAVLAQRLAFLLIGLPQRFFQRTGHVAGQALSGQQAGAAAQQRRGALVGQFDAPLRIAHQCGHRQLFDQLPEARLTLLQLEAEHLAVAQGAFPQIQIAAHQQREQQRGRHRRRQAEGPPRIGQNRLVLGCAGHFQLPAAAVHVQAALVVERRVTADWRPACQQGLIRLGGIEQLQLEQLAARGQDSFDQIGQTKRPMQGPDQRLAPLLDGGDGGTGLIQRQEQQHARLHILLGFLFEPQGAGEGRIAAVPRGDDGVPSDLLADQVEADHAPVTPVQRINEVGDQVMVALAQRKDGEIRSLIGPDGLDQRRQPFTRNIARQGQCLDARIEILKLKLGGRLRPVVQGHLVTADGQPGQPTQHHFVGAHPLSELVFDFADSQAETLHLLGAILFLLHMPLPANPSPEPGHQCQRYQQWQPRLAGMESGTIIHSTSSAPLLARCHQRQSRGLRRGSTEGMQYL